MSMSSVYSKSGPEEANDGVTPVNAMDLGLNSMAHTEYESNAWIQAELPKTSWIVRAVVWMRVSYPSKTQLCYYIFSCDDSHLIENELLGHE